MFLTRLKRNPRKKDDFQLGKCIYYENNVEIFWLKYYFWLKIAFFHDEKKMKKATSFSLIFIILLFFLKIIDVDILLVSSFLSTNQVTFSKMDEK